MENVVILTMNFGQLKKYSVILKFYLTLHNA